MQPTIIIRKLGLVSYLPIYQAMQDFTSQRDEHTPDELWVLQHPPIYTLGIAAKPEHLLDTGDIPVQQIDRGGQVTYHAPGQLVVYVLVNLKRHGWGVKRLVSALEKAVIGYLAQHGVIGQSWPKAPGVYVGERKIAALGLRIRRNCSYHGLSLNVAMDLSGFQGINPCGYPGLAVTQLTDCGITDDLEHVTAELIPVLVDYLGYTTSHVIEETISERSD